MFDLNRRRIPVVPMHESVDHGLTNSTFRQVTDEQLHAARNNDGCSLHPTFNEFNCAAERPEPGPGNLIVGRQQTACRNPSRVVNVNSTGIAEQHGAAIAQVMRPDNSPQTPAEVRPRNINP